MRNLHEHYDKLTGDERYFVDEAMRGIFSLQKERKSLREFAPQLYGDDTAEEATDALAKWVIVCRENKVGRCTSCGKQREFALETDGNVFYPGSRCGQCGHVEVVDTDD